MIITAQKTVNEIIEALKPYKKIFIVGCAACATKCQTGSEEAVKKIKDELQKAGFTVSGYAVLDTPCDMRIAKRDLGHSAEVKSADALLILACGAGVQSIEKIVSKPLVPGVNPLYIGTTERIGIYHQYCLACGKCVIDRTGGICPVARCPKSMVNGPCGSFFEGKCEVDRERDCVWTLIYSKCGKTEGGKKSLMEYSSPRDHSIAIKSGLRKK